MCIAPDASLRKFIAGCTLAVTIGGCAPMNHRMAGGVPVARTTAPLDKGATVDKVLIIGLFLIGALVILFILPMRDPNY
jgi:hypothetical protein